MNKPDSNYEKYSILLLAVLLILLSTISLVQRKKAKDQMKVLKTPDYLTGLLNRGTGLTFLQQKIDETIKNSNKLTIIFADVNHLKMVNDTYGHQEGDKLIQAASRLLLKGIRKSDGVCRFGGDEFMLILPGCDLSKAMEIWAKIEGYIELYNIEQRHKYLLSLSQGFAEYDPENPISVDALIKKADTEMYIAKRLYKVRLDSEEVY